MVLVAVAVAAFLRAGATGVAPGRAALWDGILSGTVTAVLEKDQGRRDTCEG